METSLRNGKVCIIEKPEWVSWDDIHNVLWLSHSRNRDKGINMRKPGLPGDEIKKEIEPNGKMFVAMENERVIGTAAIVMKFGNAWYDNGLCGYLCFASLLPEYQGSGIYKRLMCSRECYAIEAGAEMLCFDTHIRNEHVIKINKKNGFVPVGIKACSDHFNVIMIKWIGNSPYSRIGCKYRYWKSRLAHIVFYSFDREKGLKYTFVYRLTHWIRK